MKTSKNKRKAVTIGSASGGILKCYLIDTIFKIPSIYAFKITLKYLTEDQAELVNSRYPITQFLRHFMKFTRKIISLFLV